MTTWTLSFFKLPADIRNKRRLDPGLDFRRVVADGVKNEEYTYVLLSLLYK